MITSKDLARKIAAGCSHSVAVLVPCAHCIETQMNVWAAQVKEDYRATLRNDWQVMESDLAGAKKEAESVRKQNVNLSSNLRRLHEENAVLQERLKKATSLLTEARIQLHAEQASKRFVKVAEA